MRKKMFSAIFAISIVILCLFVSAVYAQENETIDIFENIDIEFVVLGVLAGLLYALLGWCASGENFESTKFVRTFSIVTLVALGLDLGDVTFDIYSAMLEPMAITVFFEKTLNSATKRKT